MTHWKQNFDYKYTGAYELQPNEEKVVTIEKTCIEEVKNTDGKTQLCFVAYFKENPKPMVLNKTNCKTIEKLYTPMVENWIGKKITVFAAKVKAFGDTVEALRVRPTVPVDKAIDFTPYVKQIEACKTLEELQSLYLSEGFPSREQVVITAKDKKKNELSTNRAE